MASPATKRSSRREFRAAAPDLPAAQASRRHRRRLQRPRLAACCERCARRSRPDPPVRSAHERPTTATGTRRASDSGRWSGRTSGSHDGDWTVPGFRVLFVHRFGNWRMGVRSPVAPRSAEPGSTGGCIGRSATSTASSWTSARRSVGGCTSSISPAIVINGYCEIGDDCILRHSVTMGIRSLDDMTGAPTLGRGVDVGAGAVILGRITVGDGAQIGANAVVLRGRATGGASLSAYRRGSSSGRRHRARRVEP